MLKNVMAGGGGGEEGHSNIPSMYGSNWFMPVAFSFRPETALRYFTELT